MWIINLFYNNIINCRNVDKNHVFFKPLLYSITKIAKPTFLKKQFKHKAEEEKNKPHWCDAVP